MAAHARFSPSKMERIVECPGSLALEEYAGPDSVSLFALEGTAAHELAATAFAEVDPFGYIDSRLGKSIEIKEDGVPYYFEVTEEMADAVKTYIQSIYDRRAAFEEMGAEVGLLVEQRVDISAAVGIEGQFGTADIIMLATFPDKSSVLVVEDLKYGKGVAVSAEKNVQLMTYAAGAYATLQNHNPDSIIVAIHQPRLNSMSEYEFTPLELAEFSAGLAEAARKAQDQIKLFSKDKDAGCLDLTPGEKQCRFCRAKGMCPALAKFSVRTITECTDVTVEDFDDLTKLDDALPEVIDDASRRILAGGVDAAMLARFMDSADMVECWIKAVRSRVERLLLDGNNAEGLVPGYMLAEGRKGSRAWRDAEAAEELLKSMRLKSDEMYNKKVISPTQAEKVLKESPRKWTKVQELIVRADGAPSVVKDSDTKRKRWVVEEAAVEFEDLEAAEVA